MEENKETNMLLSQILEEMKKTNNMLATNEKYLRETCVILFDLFNKIPVDYCCNALRVNNIN